MRPRFQAKCYRSRAIYPALPLSTLHFIQAREVLRAERRKQKLILRTPSQCRVPFLLTSNPPRQLPLPRGIQHLLSPARTEIPYLGKLEIPHKSRSRRPGVQTAQPNFAPPPKIRLYPLRLSMLYTKTSSNPKPRYSHPPQSHLLTATRLTTPG